MCVCVCVCVLLWVCVCVCVCRTPEERREEDPLNNAVLLSASGCVCLWLVPWTALLAVAHCTCTYCWRGRERAGAQEREGGAARRSQTRQTLCVCVLVTVLTHTHRAAAELYLSLHWPYLSLFSFHSDGALADRLTSAAGASGLSIKSQWHRWYWTAPRWVKVCRCADLTPLLPCCCEECILNPLFFPALKRPWQ